MSRKKTDPVLPADGAMKPKEFKHCGECDSQMGCEALGKCRESILSTKPPSHPGATTTPKRGRGRPSKYTDELAEEVCRRLAEGESLNAICHDEHMPDQSTVRRWALDNIHDFSPKYVKAREIQMDHLAERLLATSQMALGLPSEGVAAMRLIVDTQKWFISKVAPKKYGDRLVQEHVGKDGGPIQTESKLDLSTLGADDRAALKAILGKQVKE